MNANPIYQFITAINSHNLEALGELMTGDHLFIDAHDNRVEGKEKMLDGWNLYFEWFPDYKIEVTYWMHHDSTFALFGFAEGTFNTGGKNEPDAHWRLPASWRAVVRDAQIAEWQVYADTKIPFEIIQKYGPKAELN